MFRNHVSYTLIENKAVLGVMGAFWDLTILPGPRHFIYTVIDPKATSSTSLLIAEVKKYIASQGFSLRRVGFSFYPELHDNRIHDSFKSQGFIPSAKDHRMKLDLPCEFQPRGLHQDYSIEEVTENTIYELLATWTTIWNPSKPFHQAYQQAVSDPDFTTRPYDPSVTLGFLARHGEKPVAGMAINFVGEAACVMNMLVSQNHRRKAIAQNMLDEASSTASQKGCQIMLVDSADDEAAIGLYQKVGFRDMGIHEYFVFRGGTS